MMPSEAPNVYRALQNAAGQWPGRPLLNVLPSVAQVYDIDPGQISFSNALTRVDHWAERLQSAGYTSGMRVAVLLENRPEFFLLWLALNRLGASIVPINPDLRVAELEYLIAHAEPALIVTIAPRVAELQVAADAAEVSVQAVTPDDRLPRPRRKATVATLTGDDMSREAAVLYTSGTTGNPKGCVLSNSYFLEVARWYTSLGGIVSLSTDGERMITPLPIFHMNAMAYSFMAMLSVGGCLTALDRFHPSTWWQDVADSGATCLHYLGVMPSMLMGAAPALQDRAHRVRFGFGAGVDPKLQAAFEDRFGFPLMEAWAMTETGAGAVISAHELDRLIGQSALGRVPDWLDVRLIDEDGRDVPESAPGELLVRRKGDQPRLGFFKEYYKNPSATAEAWEGGWFHTGDIVRRGEGGNMFFVDRRKNVIRRSGENISAVEVESILMRHPQVRAAGVAAVPDPIRGDEVFACLSVDDPTPETAQAITKWALGQMAYYKVPGFIAFVDQLPLTATHKIQRKALKELALQLRDDTATVTLTHLKKRQVVA